MAETSTLSQEEQASIQRAIEAANEKRRQDDIEAATRNAISESQRNQPGYKY